MNSSTAAADGWNVPVDRVVGLSRATVVNLFYLVLCGLSIIPFVLIDHPPIVDFANHAARLNIACHPASFANMYQYKLGIIPNLAVDLVNAPLCGLVQPGNVLKLVTAAALGLIYLSGWLIQRRLFGGINAFLFVLPAMAFNLVTTMGYINFLAGIGVMMLIVALAIRRVEQFKAMLVLCNLGGIVLFFCHVFALAAALIIVFGLYLHGKKISAAAIIEAGLRTLLSFAVPLAMLMFVPSGAHHFVIEVLGKIRVVVALFMAQQYSIGLYGFLLAIPLYLLVRRRLVEIDPLIRAPLVVLAIYIVVMPNQLSDAVDIDTRTFVALAYLLFTALRPVGRVREISLAVAAISAFYVGLQLWNMITVWQPFSSQIDEFRQSIAVLPEGAPVLSVSAEEPAKRPIIPSMSYSHVASYATAERRVFNPLEFTGVGMQPMSAQPAYARLDTPAGLPFSALAAVNLASPTPRIVARAREHDADYALEWPRTFDYVIYYHFGEAPNFDPAALETVRVGSFFSILKVKKARAA